MPIGNGITKNQALVSMIYVGVHASNMQVQHAYRKRYHKQKH